MPLPRSWVDALFARLALRYGEAFRRQWPDVDEAAVKADWADVLDGVSGASIGYALRYLPVDKPPNAMQFRDQCRRAPPPDVPQLRDETPPADPEKVAAIVAGMRPPERRAHPAQECIDAIARRVAESGRISEAQRHMVAHCLRVPGTRTDMPVTPVGGARIVVAVEAAEELQP